MLAKLRRIGQISHVFFHYRFYALIPTQLQPWYVKLLINLMFWYPKASKQQSQEEHLRAGLERLGPVWIKLGQMLSTRKDLLTPDLSEALTKLQDKVSPFNHQQAIELIQQELNLQQLSDLFYQFDTTPLATASIAQVHAGQIEIDGQLQDVVVKVIRPNIKQQIEADIALMYSAAKWVQRTLSDSKRFRPVEVVKEYETTILNELNLTSEASNGSQLKQNFLDSDDLYIPHIYQQYSTAKVMVMERIDGIPVADVEAIIAQGSDLKKLAERGVRLFFTQVFRDSFFHADMHPGNIFIAKENPEDPKYIGIDFGIIGTLNSEDKRYLAENFVAFFNRDYLKVAQLHVQSGWVPSHVNVEQFEMAIRAVCDPIFNKPLEEISFAQVLIGLFDTARQFEMQVQPQLVLLQKTLLYVEGLGRQLYPQLDLWDTAKPFLENWVSEQMGFKAFVNKTKNNLPYWLEQAPQIPELVHASLTTINQLPGHKQDLIEQYKQLQHQHQKFLLRLTSTSLSFLTLLACLLFADNSVLGWQMITIASAVISLVGFISLRK